LAFGQDQRNRIGCRTLLLEVAFDRALVDLGRMRLKREPGVFQQHAAERARRAMRE
jgi:hypothetical protein